MAAPPFKLIITRDGTVRVDPPAKEQAATWDPPAPPATAGTTCRADAAPEDVLWDPESAISMDGVHKLKSTGMYGGDGGGGGGGGCGGGC
jgi:hypothetical protein